MLCLLPGKGGLPKCCTCYELLCLAKYCAYWMLVMSWLLGMMGLRI